MSADGKTAQTGQTTQAAAAAQPARGVQTKHVALRYLTLRIAIFLVSLGVLWGVVVVTGHTVTTNGALYLMMGAILTSGVASFFLLSRQRDEISVRLSSKITSSAAMEDED